VKSWLIAVVRGASKEQFLSTVDIFQEKYLQLISDGYAGY
jgi:hypothetical protein